MNRRSDMRRSMLDESALAVAVAGAGNTTLLEFGTEGLERIYVHVDVADQALDAFLIQGKATQDAGYDTLYSAAADYTAPQGLLLGTSGDLTAIAAAGSGWFVMDVRPLAGLKILVSAVADHAVVDAYLGGA